MSYQFITWHVNRHNYLAKNQFVPLDLLLIQGRKLVIFTLVFTCIECINYMLLHGSSIIVIILDFPRMILRTNTEAVLYIYIHVLSVVKFQPVFIVFLAQFLVVWFNITGRLRESIFSEPIPKFHRRNLLQKSK